MAAIFGVVLFAIVGSNPGVLIWVLFFAIVGFGFGFPTLLLLISGGKTEARLRLSRSSNGEPLLSLFTLPPTAEDIDINLPDNKAHFLDVPVRSVSSLVSDFISGDRMSFYVFGQGQPGRDRIQISGSRQELEWLKAHISNWGGMPMN